MNPDIGLHLFSIVSGTGAVLFISLCSSAPSFSPLSAPYVRVVTRPFTLSPSSHVRGGGEGGGGGGWGGGGGGPGGVLPCSRTACCVFAR